MIEFDLDQDTQTALFEEGLERAREDTARQAVRFDNHFGDDSARSLRAAQHAAKHQPAPALNPYRALIFEHLVSPLIRPHSG